MQYVVLEDFTFFDKFHGGEQGLVLLQYRKSIFRSDFYGLNSHNMFQALANFSVNFLERFDYISKMDKNTNKDLHQKVKIAEEIYNRLFLLYPELIFITEKRSMEAYHFTDNIEHLLNNSFKLHFVFLHSTIDDFFKNI